jgi:hypothetical protein
MRALLLTGFGAPAEALATGRVPPPAVALAGVRYIKEVKLFAPK